MNVAVVIDGVESEVTVDVEQAQGTVADLVAALTGRPHGSDGVLVDGSFVAADTRLPDAGIRQGSVLEPAGGPRPAPGPEPVVEVRVVGGLEAGTTVPLPAGSHVIGRDPSASVALVSTTVSEAHVFLDVKPDATAVVDDNDSKNGTAIEGYPYGDPIRVEDGQVVQIGAVQFTVGTPRRGDVPVLGRPRRNGTVTFNRPPRAMAKANPPVVKVPAAPKEPSAGMRFSVVAMVVPLVFGIGMALATPVKAMAAFALLSPLMMGANYLQDRRRVQQEKASGSAAFATGLKAFRRTLTHARLGEVARRRAVLPDPAEVIRRATAPSTRLWERRPSHDDFLQLSAGLATLAWTPPLDSPGGERPTEIDQALNELGWLPLAPLGVDLSPGRTLGVTGRREPALALVRNLICQAATHHGPADVRIAVLTEPSRAEEWDWVKWLPHAHSTDEASGRRLLAAAPEDVGFVLEELLAARPDEDGKKPAGPVTLVVIDAEGLTEGRNAPARELLSGAGGPACGIVLAGSADRLPALCTSIVELQGTEGLARYREPSINLEIADALAAGIPEPLARRCARGLSGFEDPEVPDQGADLPGGVSLVDLLGMELTPEAIVDRWRKAGSVPRLAGPVGAYGEGTLELDLVADGPHGLVAGTTGSGKSELLRSLVAGLAVSVDPEHLNFVLVDYKGGAAFADCAALPHTVGMVTDLDEHLGQRALRCLEAELRYRETRLREAGVSDLKEYLREGYPEPLPRLVVIIDEFATMAAELPDFIDSLVGIAQRGRSLGVHMILATQRPGGAVNDNIRANTNLRIALRVQDPAESSDVVGSPLAASIGRKQAGRGYVRLGPSEVFPFQTALVTGVTRPEEARGVSVSPFAFGPEAAAVARPAVPSGPAPGQLGPPGRQTDLERLVPATVGAAALTGMRPSRRPWPDPLPGRVLLDELLPVAPLSGSPAGAALALADDPEAQSRRTLTWAPPQGNLLVCGVPGSGTTTALSSLAVSLARTYRPERLHFYVLDFGTQAMAPLVDLPHCGGVVGSSDRERQFRLVRLLADELERRRRHIAASGAVRFDPADEASPFPSIVVFVDNYGALHAAWEDNVAGPVRDLLVRVIADGPGLGVVAVLSTDRPLGLPGGLSSVIPNKMALRLADPSEFSFFGISPKDVGKLPPGRGIDASTKLEFQVALPHEAGLQASVAGLAAQLGAVDATGRPAAIGTLPEDVRAGQMATSVRLEDGEWFLPVGVGDTTLSPVGLRLLEGEHVFISGSPRSGKSSTLDALAAVVGERLPDVVITAIATRRSPLQQAPEVRRLVTSAEEIGAAAAAVLEDPAPQLVLIDDADGLDDASGALAGLIGKGRPDLHLVVAARPDSLRTNYIHWTVPIRTSRQGLALKPNLDQDGNLWNLFLPRSGPTSFVPGRGYLIAEGQPELVQAARR